MKNKPMVLTVQVTQCLNISENGSTARVWVLTGEWSMELFFLTIQEKKQKRYYTVRVTTVSVEV